MKGGFALKKQAHVMVATPMYGGMCSGYYTQSLIQTAMMCANKGIKMSFAAMFNESLIQRGRNALARQFMQSDATHLFFIDADIRWNFDDVRTMIEADKDIICGIYPKKEINWEGVSKAAKDGVETQNLRGYSGALVVNLVDYKGTTTVARDTPVEIWNGGTGFMCIKREVMEKLAELVPVYNNDVMDLSGQMAAGDKITEYFACSIEEGTNRLLSEDYHFCMVARKHGFKVYAAPWVHLGHMGSYLFEGGLLPAK